MDNSKDNTTTTSHRRPRKRSRNSKGNPGPALPVSAHILSLPFELIAEILLYTASPKAVLAVARCSKYLCNTLLRTQSNFIWRSVRNHCLPGPLPDPLPMSLSESAFAALIFDGGACSSCGKMTQNMFSSWSLRVRFCSRPECKESFAKNVRAVTNSDGLTRHDRKALAWIPLAESPACVLPREDPQTWPGGKKVYLTATMDAALAEYAGDSSSAVDKRHADDITRALLKMTFYVTLHNWKLRRQALERQVRTENETFGKALAANEGYVYTELLNGSPTFQKVHAHRTKNLEFLTRLDYDVVAAKVETEMISMQDKQMRRTNEATLRGNRAQVEQHYQRLVSASRSRVPPDPLPSLTEFRAMPVLHLLQSPAFASAPKPKIKKVPGVTHELQGESLVNQMLTSELTRWRKNAEALLGATLGITEWKTARSNKLHPVARLTARWNCGKCGKVAGAYKWDECLDYHGVCKHECPQSKKGKEPLWSWKAENFVRDDKAINAMTKLVKLCGIDTEDPRSFKVLEDIGPRIQCLSCSAAIVMAPSSVPGHSHRHEEMNMSLLTQAEVDALVADTFAINTGLAKKLMEHDDFKVKQEQKKWMFGCRHCDQHAPPAEEKASEPGVTDGNHIQPSTEGDDKIGEAQLEGKNEPVRKEKNQKKQPKTFEFNGLRSHLKEKCVPGCVSLILSDTSFADIQSNSLTTKTFTVFTRSLRIR
ncbi:hypothetical protein K438DRAFT_1738533 [Mycena galopus ATCC 62051]|nr:hypothetical protein K438DRAFT_1738533 [Mycena galopus ATCC 62051]